MNQRIKDFRKYLGHIVVTSFTFFLLQLDRDATDRTGLDTLHQMGNETGNLISQTFARDDGDFLADAFVGVKVERQTWVVLFDNHPRRLLDGLGTHTTLSRSIMLLVNNFD